MITLEVSLSSQEMMVYDRSRLIQRYLISTAKKGAGEGRGSEQTPRGWHVIRAKIGANVPENTVFVGRRPTGERYSAALRAKYPQRDWILTRILWLSGLEKGKNRLGHQDTMQRYIYIHGTPDDVPMGMPGSRGCIRMRNCDIVFFFDFVPVQTRLFIQE